MKMAIIGSRVFNDYELLCNHLEVYKNKVTLIISGGARGADSLGEKWAQSKNIQTLIFPAEWDKYGKNAGYIRNEDIIKNCDICVAFWDGKSKGTSHSIKLCKKYNKQILIFKI